MLECWSRDSIRFGLRSSALLFFRAPLARGLRFSNSQHTATFLLGICPRARVCVYVCEFVCVHVCVGVNVKRNFCTAFIV
uniref:GM06913p n=1 Tax=Drosophila melanogaster TaxID=7227 RepID=Q8T948_DROME|nr:GM06913p [Drosophila melanogaster]